MKSKEKSPGGETAPYEAGPSAECYGETYRNAEGEKICDVEYEVERGTGIHTKKVKSLTLMNIAGERVDVFAICGVPENVRVNICDYPDFQPAFSRYMSGKGGDVRVSGIDTPQQFGVLLHEIGHALQSAQMAFISAWETYRAKDCKPTYLYAGEWVWTILETFDIKETGLSLEQLSFVRKIGSESRAIGERLEKTLEEKERSESRLFTVREAIRALSPKRSEAIEKLERQLQSEVEQFEKQLEAIRRERSPYFKIWEEATRDEEFALAIGKILRAPEAVFERDANRFVLKVLRALKSDHGVDLLQKVSAEYEDVKDQQKVGRYLRELDEQELAELWTRNCGTVTTIQDQLRANLGTRWADNRAIRARLGAPPRSKRQGGSQEKL